MSRQQYAKLFNIPEGHELKSGDWIYGITTGENYGSYVEIDERGKRVARYVISEHLDGAGELVVDWYKEDTLP